MADFSNSISSLRSRARSARKSFRLIGIGVFILVCYAFTFVVFRYTQDSQRNLYSLREVAMEMNYRSSKSSPDSIFLPYIQKELSENLGPITEKDDLKTDNKIANEKVKSQTVKNVDRLRNTLDPIVNYYERINKSRAIQNESKASKSSETEYGSLVSTLALSIGAVALVILVMQIAVNFMRYYARLAELYEAQADALEASDGDPVVAYQFVEKFSPLAVDFEKLPKSLYEKSIDAVIDIAKSKK